MKNWLIRFFLLFCISILLLANITFNDASAYSSSTNGTHQFIFEQARKILRNDGYKSIADFLDSIDPSSGLTYLEILIKGSDENDRLIAASQHYMDPMDHRGLWFIWYQKSAGTLCQERFNQAILDWQRGDYYNAMYNLGWATHLLQDVSVPHHAWTTYLFGHGKYEGWVDNNKYFFAVDSGGLYSFSSFPDLQFYISKHYSWTDVSAHDWVDYNAHESLKHFLRVNSRMATYVTDAAVPYVETIHPLPNSLETTWVITTYQTSKMQLHFEKIYMENSFDYIYIFDKYDNLLDVYTGQHGDFWTPEYLSGDALKIKVKTDYSMRSWGYRIKEVRYFDTGEDLYGAANTLLPLAQRATAGFVHFFFMKADLNISQDNASE